MKSISVLALGAAFLFLLFPAPASAEMADDVKCTGCVGSPDILDFGIKTKDLGVGAVTTPKINDGAVNAKKLKDGAVDWQKLAVSLQDRIVQLETALGEVQAELQATRDALSASTVLKLDGYLDLDTSDPARPTARFAGVNVQVVNGVGETESVNGLGNLIIGYDEAYDGALRVCSDGEWGTELDCVSNGAIWSLDHKSGSHNVIIGQGHRYSQDGGLVAGRNNAITRVSATVSGGKDNVARGIQSAVHGGSFNTASGRRAVVSGGGDNLASDRTSVVSGGEDNISSGRSSVVSGGFENEASEDYAVVSGGSFNTARGDYSVVSGGYLNFANDENSVVSGGSNNAADGDSSAVSGGYFNTATGDRSVVSGGWSREANGDEDWVAGELWQDQ